MYKKIVFLTLLSFSFVSNSMHRVNRVNEERNCMTQRDVTICCFSCCLGFCLGFNEYHYLITKRCSGFDSVEKCVRRINQEKLHKLIVGRYQGVDCCGDLKFKKSF